MKLSWQADGVPSLPFDLPEEFVAFAGRDPGWARWIAGVPRLLGDLLEEWGLVVDGPATHGRTALVVPVDAGGERAVLKVSRPHDDAQHEALGLQSWHGVGAVRLLRADPHRQAMLLERLHPQDLTIVPVLDACGIVAGLYQRLHVPAPPRLVPLTRHVQKWIDALADLPRHAPVPHRIVEQAVHLGRGFMDDAGSVGRLIHADLHYGNVLAADREPWLAIDPQPISGDPHWEVAPLLSNRWDEAVATGDVRAAVRRRFHTVIDSAGLDEHRARDWIVVREAVNAMWAVEVGDADRVTRAVTIIKAVQD